MLFKKLLGLYRFCPQLLTTVNNAVEITTYKVQGRKPDRLMQIIKAQLQILLSVFSNPALIEL